MQGKIRGKTLAKLPLSSHAFVDKNGKGHLPYKAADGTIDAAHTRDALARLGQVQGMTPAERTATRGKLQAALRAADARSALARG